MIFARGNSSEIIVETVVVEKGNVKEVITATGTIEPVDKVEIGTQVSGVIEKIYVDYNDDVKKGQLLAELDKTVLKSSVNQNRAQLQTARAEVDYQRKNYMRKKTLLEKDMISQEVFDQAVYSYQNAKATLARAEAELEKSEINLDYATIYSPIDGVVLSRAVEEGQTVAASLNAPVLFTIARNLSRMQVQVDVDEADIGQVKKNQSASFTVDAFMGENFAGMVKQVRLEPVVNSNVVTYTVIVEAHNPNRKLMPGMTATVSITTREAKDVLTIPAKVFRFQLDPGIMEAYAKKHNIKKPASPFPAGTRQKIYASSHNDGFERPEGGHPGSMLPSAGSTPDHTELSDDYKMIWIKEENNIIHPVRVKIGVYNGITAEVIEGLSGNEQIVVNMTCEKPKSTAVEQRQSSPFMPHPPGRNRRK